MKSDSIVNAENRIEKYIAKMATNEPLQEGERNDGLYNSLRCFRKEFYDLSPEQFRQYALNIAAVKCCPPLSDIEVAGVIESVLKANITPNATRPALRATKPPVNRSHIVPAVPVDAVPVHAPTEPQITINEYLDGTDKTPLDYWCNIVKRGTSVEAVEAFTGEQQSDRLVFPMFSITDAGTERTGGIEYRTDGTAFENGQKCKIQYQSKSGIVGNKSGLMLLLEHPEHLTQIIKTEGVPDALAVYTALSEQERASTFVFCNGSGASENPNKPPFIELINRIGEANTNHKSRLYIVGDNDKAGQDGANRWGLFAQQQGCSVSVVFPPVVGDRKIKDARDFLLTGEPLSRLLASATGELLPEPAKGKKTKNEHLDRLLAAIEPIDWKPDENDKGGITEKIAVMRTVENAINTSQKTGILFCIHNGETWIYNGKFWGVFDAGLIGRFLESAALRSGVKPNIAGYFRFIENLEKQFIGQITIGQEQTKDIVINLNNGTLHIIDGKPILKQHNPDDFLRYCLPRDYNPDAHCPQWINHLERCGFDSETIDCLAESFALPFCNLKGEQVVFIYGKPHSGKSVILDVYRGMLGEENTTAIDLPDVSQGGQSGRFIRSGLDGKLANIVTDITPKVHNSGVFKMLAEGAPIDVERKHKDSYKMIRYAKMFFAANELPYIKARELSLRKWSIFETKSIVPVTGRKLNFAKDLLKTEGSGIFNWILAGQERLTRRGDLLKCRAVAESAERYESESDNVLQWILNEGITDETPSRTLAECYQSFTEYCEAEGIERHFVPSKREFSGRLQMRGYEVEIPNRHTRQRFVFFKKNSKSKAQEAQEAQTPENKGLNVAPYIAPHQSKAQENQSRAQADTLENTAFAPVAPLAPHNSEFIQKQNENEFLEF